MAIIEERRKRRDDHKAHDRGETEGDRKRRENKVNERIWRRTSMYHCARSSGASFAPRANKPPTKQAWVTRQDKTRQDRTRQDIKVSERQHGADKILKTWITVDRKRKKKTERDREREMRKRDRGRRTKRGRERESERARPNGPSCEAHSTLPFLQQYTSGPIYSS